MPRRRTADSVDDNQETQYDFIVVSNRLPVDYDPAAKAGENPWRSSPGGLVTALEPVMREANGAWVGWTGVADREFAPFTHDEIDIVPVPLSALEVEQYYEGFSNDTLWPLYHDVIAQPTYHREWWDAYSKVNHRFAEAAAAIAAPGAVIWVQDYQLQLVPRMLRERRSDLVIGFFNHIPFPEYGIFAQLPWRKQVVEGLLGADLIGFQRAADTANFMRAVRRLTELATRGSVVEVNDQQPQDSDRLGQLAAHITTKATRRVVARHFPISIDVAGFEEIARLPRVQKRAQEIRVSLGNPKFVMLGVDRLDYTKGIRHRLKAFGELLADGAISASNVTLVQVASPSRERVESYRQLRDEIELTVGRINGEFASLGNQAVTYLHHGYPREEMVALYLAADIMLVTALRDGMNLVAKEYAACRFDEDGVLVLSEFAGAADEMRSAILVNPHDIDGLKEAIFTATQLPQRERTRRMRALRRRVKTNDVANWSASFLEALTGAGRLPAGLPDELVAGLKRIASADRILIALDFDGTLSPLVDDPEKARMAPGAREALERLIALPGVQVALVSGRALASLTRVASPAAGMLLSGSHGVELQLDERDPAIELSAKETQHLNLLTETITGMLASLSETRSETDNDIPAADIGIEPKPAGLALHTRRLPAALGSTVQRRARELVTTTIPGVVVKSGKGVIEFSVRSGNKGESLNRLRQHAGADTVLFVGDDVTDEDAFAALDTDDIGIKVGQGRSLARYRVRGVEDVVELLNSFYQARTETKPQS